MLQRGITQQIDNVYREDLWEGTVVQTDIIETPGRDYDFDQINEENMTYSRYGGTQHQQQSQNIMNDEIDPKKSQSTFNDIATEHESKRINLKRSRQAQIASRVMKIKDELTKLEKELEASEQSQEQSSAQDEKVKVQQQAAAKAQIAQLNQLKDKLQRIYQSKGFKVLTHNQKQLQYLQKTATNPQNKDELDLNELSSLMLRIQKSKLSEEEKGTEQNVTLVLDRSKQDIGLLIRLNHLQKRVNFIKYTIGEWKPTNKYKSMTDQIEYVQKRMELLDPQKLHFLQSRTKHLNDDIFNLQSNLKEVKEIGHDKEEIDELYASAIKVKQTMSNVNKYVERLEQKKKMHDMSAKVLIDIESLEEQQNLVIRSTKENKQLLEYIQDGMTQNLDQIKSNIQFLKAKAESQKQQQ